MSDDDARKSDDRIDLFAMDEDGNFTGDSVEAITGFSLAELMNDSDLDDVQPVVDTVEGIDRCGFLIREDEKEDDGFYESGPHNSTQAWVH